MWVPKWQRDLDKGVDSPVPTQVVSNEEFIPRPQNPRQKQVEALIGSMAEEKSKKLAMDRRSFMASSMGMATAFLAMNRVYGNYWEVEEAETLELAAAEEKWPKDEYFIIDVQSHFTNGSAASRFREHGVRQGHAEASISRTTSTRTSFPNFVKEMFFDSETSLVVISGVPGKEIQPGRGRQDPTKARTVPRAPRARSCRAGQDGLAEAGAQRHGRLPGCPQPGQLCTPNHYWNPTAVPWVPISPRCSSRWSARSRPTASTPGSGIAIPIPAARAMASSSTTRS